MKIEKLSDCSVKIILTRSDLYDHGIRYDNWDSENASEFLLSVSEEIKERTGTDITHEKLYVEIFSRINSCLIFISFSPKNNISKCKKCRIAYTFDDYDSLKSFCCLIHEKFPEIIKSSSLYYNTNILCLIIEASGSYKSFLTDSVQGGYVRECDEFTDAATLEYYICAESSNAVKKIATV